MQNIRIPMKVLSDDQRVTFKLEQDFDNLETLSLTITSSEAYSRKQSDFGVVVGRVVLNNGFGVQNAKVSIFVPIRPDDKDRPEIFEIYPFETSSDTFPNGVRYNLLPRVRNGRNPSHRAVGNFPDVTDLTNYPSYLEVFETYYKYTTMTNESGDYMIFGVPLGAHDIVMDFDVFDTPSFEVTANDLVAMTTQNKTITNVEDMLKENNSWYINSDVENPEKNRVPGFVYKGEGEYDVELKTNLDEMPNIFHEVKQINVSPFWGDTDLYDIGITRCDFNVNFKFQPTAIFFGHLSSQTNSFAIKDDYSFSLKRKPEIYAKDETLGYETGDIFPLQDFDIVVYKLDDNNSEGSRKRVATYKSQKGAGYFRLTLPMYLDYFTTNEYGDLIPSNDQNVGIPTRGNYAFEMYETNDSWRGTRNVWGGYENNIIPGVRIPSHSAGDKWLGGWGGTWDGKFEYDLFNKKRKFYTIATTYRKHNESSVLLEGDVVTYFPQITSAKQEAYWNFPLDWRDTKHLDEVKIIGGCMIPRVQMKLDKKTSITTYPSSLLVVPYKPKAETYEKKVEDYEWFLGIGTSTNGLNNGPVYDDLFSGTDFMVQRQLTDGTIEKKSIYGELETFNWGDNSKENFNELKSQWAIELSQKDGANANEFSVFKPYTQVVSPYLTTGVFVNASDYQVGKLQLFEVNICDITDDIQDLVVNKVYTSYRKTANDAILPPKYRESVSEDLLGEDEFMDVRGKRSKIFNKLAKYKRQLKTAGVPGDGVFHLRNAYKGKYYFFGYWKGTNALYDIEKNYFNVI